MFISIGSFLFFLKVLSSNVFTEFRVFSGQLLEVMFLQMSLLEIIVSHLHLQDTFK